LAGLKFSKPQVVENLTSHIITCDVELVTKKVTPKNLNSVR